MLKRTTKSPSAIEWMCKTETAYKNGRPAAESEKYVRQALDADPNCCRALCWLGAILATSGRLEEAEQTVRNGIRLCPENALAHRTLGHVLMLHQKPDEADLELQQAAQLDPDSSDIFDLRGQLYGIQGMNALALQCMKIAAELNAFSAEIRANLGYCLAKNGNRDKATDALRAAEALLLQDDVGAEQFLALGYNALHDVPSAIQHYDAFLKIAKRQGLNPEAVKDFETTLAQLRSSLEPTYLDALPPKDYSDAELAELLASRLTKDELAAVKNPLARTAEMDRWARELTQGATNDLQKARMLFDRLILRLDRKNERKARTATEVFAAWNDERSAFVCQEYANLYVALARVVGLRAYFVPVSEQFNGGKALHACAGVFVENKLLLVDPAFCWFGVPHKKFEVWDDLRAIAMNLSQSRELLKQRIACKLVPDCANFQFRLAVVLIYENQTNEVPQVLECALKLESDSATAYTARAYWEFCQRRFDQTIELVQKSLELDPYQGPAYFLLGEAFLKQGRLSEARNAWRISLSCGLPDGTSEGVHERIAQANEVLTGIAGRDEIPELKYRK